jgi:hypothetical protein
VSSVTMKNAPRFLFPSPRRQIQKNQDSGKWISQNSVASRSLGGNADERVSIAFPKGNAVVTVFVGCVHAAFAVV